MPFGQSAEAAKPSRQPDSQPGIHGAAGSAPLADSDVELIRAFRAGEQAAFDRLYLKHQEYVYNICLGILSNPDDARDCTQEAFLRVYRKVGEFRAESAFSTWLYRVTVNVCVGLLRKRPKSVVASLEDEHVREVAADDPEVWTGLEREVDEELVRSVVGELPDDYRMVLVLRYFQALSYDDMVRVLGYSMGQVKVKLHRARRAFAKKWAARGLEAVGL